MKRPRGRPRKTDAKQPPKPKLPKKKAAAKSPAEAVDTAALAGTTMDATIGDDIGGTGEIIDAEIRESNLRHAPQTEPEGMPLGAIQDESELLPEARSGAAQPPISYGDVFRAKVAEKKRRKETLDKPDGSGVESDEEAEGYVERDMLLPTRVFLGNIKRNLARGLQSIERLFSQHERREAQRRDEHEKLKNQAPPGQDENPPEG